jgi:hypothetical protein
MGDGEDDRFGCERCGADADADAAWRCRRVILHRLIDQSHLIVTLRACEHCGQRFVQVLGERVDWQDGDDAQHWRLVPISAEEADALRARGEAALGAVDALARRRRHLRVDHPTGGERVVFWTSGGLDLPPGV